MVASFTVRSDAFISGKPRLWSEARITDLGGWANFDLAPDGKRFAVVLSAMAEHKPSTREMFLLRWRGSAPNDIVLISNLK